MKILAIEKELQELNPRAMSGVLQDEARQACQLYLDGYLREIYFTENHNALIILECNSREHANILLNTLPLVKNGIIKFEIMEMKPYTGYARIMN